MPTATTVIPESHLDLLHAKGFAHVASLGPDGEPQLHPLWYGLDDQGRIAISTTKDRQKYRNMRRDDRVALSILDPDDPYRHVEIRGRVTEIADDPEKRFVDELAKKYLDQDEYPHKDPEAERVTILIEPERANTMG